jgi:tRNA uridine 5-carboxymethylaminomethyl modification enzyme
LGLIDEKQKNRLDLKTNTINETLESFKKTYRSIEGKSVQLYQWLSRPESTLSTLRALYPDLLNFIDLEIDKQMEIEAKYSGYITRQSQEVGRLSKIENVKIPSLLNYDEVHGLCSEAREKLKKFTPTHLGHASKINGVSAADLSILLLHIEARQYLSTCPC